MKYSISLLCSLMFSISFFAQVNFSTYGAIGNGTVDDTAAIQAALNAETNLVADAGKTFKISGTLNITQGFAHTINWNGSTIKANNNINPMLLIDKRGSNGGLTTMTNLIVDGTLVATRGFTIRSRVNFTAVDAKRFRQPTSSSPVGIVLELYNNVNAHGSWVFDDSEVYDIVGASNGITTDSWGAANGFIVYWKEVPTATMVINIKNSFLHDSYGEDAGCLYFLDQTANGNSISNSLGSIVVDNVNIIDVERRNVKGFCGNVTYKNSTFTDPLPSNPNLYSSNKSGLVVVGSSGSSNIVLDNCTFVGRGYDGRVIPTNGTDITIKNCTFTGGADLTFTVQIGDLELCNTSFGSGSSIYGYNINNSTGYQGIISIGTNVTGPSGYNQIPAGKWQSITCSANSTPTISLIGASTINLEKNATYTEQGATATDLEDGIITGSIVTTGTVNTAVVGTYYKYYNVTDSNGNAAPQVTRTIVVSEPSAGDTVKPLATSVSVTLITETSARVEWYLDEASTGRLSYGTTTSYGLLTPNEANFLPHHIQNITGLQAGTLINFTITGQDAAGNTIDVINRTFTTLGTGSVIPEANLEAFFGGKSKRAFFKLIN